ncbi:MAG TPA: hypothetical protein VD794_10060, partial [Flavisolibacter sp.]|nr:hypothetical protein [Flavisolibacter sp.]
MKQKVLFLSLWTLLAFAGAQAQCDPWIIKAYQELYRRTPSATECNIRNYNNGSWNNYNELVSYIKKYNSQAAAPSANCDPWIVQIYKSEFGREPNATECNIKNYNNGSWASYDQLKSYIRQYKTQTTAAPATNCDLWIVDIYKKEFGREPNATECNIRNYNNGSWSSYDELKRYIKQYKGVNSSQNNNTGWKYTPSEVSGDPWIKEIYQEL